MNISKELPKLLADDAVREADDRHDGLRRRLPLSIRANATSTGTCRTAARPIEEVRPIRDGSIVAFGISSMNLSPGR
jgi:hypothetical protein